MRGMSGNGLLVAAIVSVVLALAKGSAYLLTGSVLVLASFLDSVSDAVISFANAAVSHAARKRPDREHPYGHGGFEVVSSLIQGMVLLGFALYVLAQSVNRLSGKRLFGDALGTRALDAGHLGEGVVVLAAAAFGGLLVQWLLRRNQRRLETAGERSLSVQADRAHYLADFWTNAAAAVGLLMVAMTGEAGIDAALGLVMGLVLGRTAWPILRASFRDILHREVDPELQSRIVKLAKEADARVIGIHRLRSRELGPTLFVDFHLKLPADLSLKEAHDIGERVVRHIRREIPRIDAMLHLDPDTEPDDDLWEPRV